MGTSADWSELTDAKGERYDPRPALAAIAKGREAEGYDELWERVHHQGDLGTAAYAVVPELARLMQLAVAPNWRAYALVATVEERRLATANPALPEWLLEPYQNSIQAIILPATSHLQQAAGDLEVRSLLAVLAQAKGQRTVGAIALWTEDERQEAIGEL